MTERRWIQLVALIVDCDLRTAQRAVHDGPDVIRTVAVRERARAVIARRRELEKAFVRIAA